MNKITKQKVVEVTKSNYKTILYVLLGAVAVYAMIYLLTPKPSMPEDYKNQIDSLSKANAALVEKQLKIDSAIQAHQAEIDATDFRIDNIKEKTTVVREYYHEISKEAQSYSTNQVDSFLRSRYNY